tara:strand:+ start:35 stop:1159 length:1125 start_codon:yes stop_codon:yes gene_type:complete
MLQNKIYQNFLIEISKTFLVVLFGLSIIALTVRAVSFLDLIVENGYPVITYFEYSFLNLFGLAPKFIPISFLIALTAFILKRNQESDFLILWTSGVKKIYLVNLFFFFSIAILIIYLIFSVFLTPLALNKSRTLLSKEQLNSILPTIKTQQFSDTFKGFSFLVEKKNGNEISNIFINDKNNYLKNLTSNSAKINTTTIIAEKGLVDKKKVFLFNGQIISSKKNLNTELIKFDQINIDLSKLNNTVIKKPKIQETNTLELLSCFSKKAALNDFCNDMGTKNEVMATLNRRIVFPFYIPVVSLICGLLLISQRNKLLNRYFVFFYSFALLVSIELVVRYTGLNDYLRILFVVTPFFLLFILYIFLIFNFSKETKKI